MIGDRKTTVTPEQIAKAIYDLADHLTARGVPKDEVSSAIVGIGLRLALESGIALSTAHRLVDRVYQEVSRARDN